MRKQLIAIVVAAAFPLGAIAASTAPETRTGNTGASGSVGVGASTESSGGVREMGSNTREPGAGSVRPSGRATGPFHPLDTNKDGFVSREEARGSADFNRRFTELDKDGNGRLSGDEMGTRGRGVGASGSVGVGSSTEPSGGVRDTSAPRNRSGTGITGSSRASGDANTGPNSSVGVGSSTEASGGTRDMGTR